MCGGEGLGIDMNNLMVPLLSGLLTLPAAHRISDEPPTTQGVHTADGPVEGSAAASVDDDIRFAPTTRPATPEAQHPPESNDKNVDTGKPVHEWQRLTDDWGGLRPWLDDHGVSFQASLTLDSSTVLTGGVDHGSAFRGLLNANVTVDTDKLARWKGGTFFTNFQQQSGDNGGVDAGDIQGVSNIDADGRTQISEVWFEQKLWDDRLRIKVGKVDANGDFAHTPDADEFINGSFGGTPAILGFPTYPDPAMSANVFVKPIEHLDLGFGVYDGSTQAGHTTGDDGPAGFVGGASHLFYVGEAGWSYSVKGALDGRLSAGAWHHTAEFPRFDGGTDDGATGQYAMLDQKLWRENPDKPDDPQGIAVFARYAHASGVVSAIEHQVDTGLAWTGLIPHRDDDVLGLGLTWAGISDHAGLAVNNETVYELFYRLRLTTWFSVKPDMQYIHDGAAGAKSDTVVGTIRVVIDF